MKAWRWNGAAYEPCDSLPLTDRGFRYGMSVFESLRVTADAAEFFDRHLSRLVQACAEREIPVEESALAAAEALLCDAAGELLREKGESGFARLYVTAGDGSPATAAEQPRLFVFLEARMPSDPEDPW